MSLSPISRAQTFPSNSSNQTTSITKKIFNATSGCTLSNIALKVCAVAALPLTLLADLFIAIAKCICCLDKSKLSTALVGNEKNTIEFEDIPEDAFIQDDQPSEELIGTEKGSGKAVYECRDAAGNYTYLAGHQNGERKEVSLNKIAWLMDR